MIRHFSICFCLSFITASIPSRAANKPYARTDGQTIKVWTNNDLAQLHSLGLISIVGQVDEETSVAEPAPIPSKITQDPEWYAEQAARLRDELEYRRAQLREYRQALDDARSLFVSGRVRRCVRLAAHQPAYRALDRIHGHIEFFALHPVGNQSTHANLSVT
jgi:hypothetical protein